ncbi:glycosyltransferase family 2 protein [Micromonospora sp. CPCC 206060]|uniref:glycosyltransferase family 2 protein n=1 Tax=Micromonospora sp. CPCC 206060 TaxID=3122406 RepID=UPI002FEF2938
MPDTPRVSLGVPLYNAERYLECCLDALLAQDHPDFEIVISDNASTDRTWRICQEYAARDDRIRLYRNPRNLGGHVNYTRVVELARGELFKWVAYDDICLPGYVSACVAALDAAGPRTVLAYPRTLLIDGSGEPIGAYPDRLGCPDPRPWRRVAQVARYISLCHAHFGLFRIATLRRTRLIRPFLSSDYSFLAEVAALGEIHEVPQQLFLRRLHGASTRQSPTGTLADAVSWFAPEGRWVLAPRLRMLAETLRILATADVDAGTRLSCTLAFAATWGTRRVRVYTGRWRRQLTGRPTSAPLGGGR